MIVGAIILTAMFLIPALTAGFMCVKTSRKMKKLGLSFSYSFLDLLTATILCSILLWITYTIWYTQVSGSTVSFALLYLPVLWISLLTGIYRGRCFAIQRGYVRTSPLVLILAVLVVWVELQVIFAVVYLPAIWIFT